MQNRDSMLDIYRNQTQGTQTRTRNSSESFHEFVGYKSIISRSSKDWWISKMKPTVINELYFRAPSGISDTKQVSTAT